MNIKMPGAYLQRTSAAIGVGLAAVSIGLGVAKDVKANKAGKEALGKVKPYQTPKEVLDVLNATQSNAQSGFDATTLDYLTKQTDNAFSGSLATAEKLGGDPNALSAIFGQKIDGIMQIGAQNHQLQMSNFSAYLTAKNAVAANSAAELKSQQDLLKNQLQKVAQDKADATQQIAQGINTGISAVSNYGIAKLLAGGNTPTTYAPQTTNTTGYVPPPIASSTSLRGTGMGIG